MKHKLISVVLFFAMFCSVNITFASDRIDTKGTWGNNRIRSIIPEYPEAYLNGNTLSILFTDALTDLTVSVTDANNQVVYMACISAESNEIYVLPCVLSEGEYLISLSHHYGQLDGVFTVE